MIDVKIITGCRQTYRQKHGLPLYLGPSYLKQCIDSVISSDINLETLKVYNDLLNDKPESQSEEHRDVLTYIEKYLDIKVIHNKGGNTNHNFIETIIDFDQNTSHTLVLEDDVIVHKNIISKVGKWISKKDIVFGTLYNCGKWNETVAYNIFWGGQALLIKNSYISKFVHAFYNYSEICPGCQTGWIDIMFSRIAGSYLKVPILVHNPSLVQHIGAISCWTDRGLHIVNDFIS